MIVLPALVVIFLIPLLALLAILLAKHVQPNLVVIAPFVIMAIFSIQLLVYLNVKMDILAIVKLTLPIQSANNVTLNVQVVQK